MEKENMVRRMEMITLSLVVLGAFNWGLVGIFSFDLVAAIFGSMTVLSRIVYSLIGVAAVYQLSQFKIIREKLTHLEAH
jgi:hypothetical protein